MIVSGFIFMPPITTPLSPSVEVRILPDKVVEEQIQPPPAPLITPRPVVVAMPPIVIQQVPAPPSQAPPALPPSGQSVAGGPPGRPRTAPLPSDYLRRLLAYLSGYRNYPPEARRLREQGTVRLHLIFDRNGHVLSCTVSGSSGSVTLDEAALAMVRRAEPLPAAPADYPGETLDLIVPVRFFLR